MATPTTGTAICPYCASDTELVIEEKHRVSGPLITDHAELLRHRDESKDLQVDRRTGKPADELTDDERELATIASVPTMRAVELDGLTLMIPAGFRPCFVHVCPTSRQRVVLFADSKGGSAS